MRQFQGPLFPGGPKISGPFGFQWVNPRQKEFHKRALPGSQGGRFPPGCQKGPSQSQGSPIECPAGWNPFGFQKPPKFPPWPGTKKQLPPNGTTLSGQTPTLWPFFGSFEWPQFRAKNRQQPLGPGPKGRLTQDPFPEPIWAPPARQMGRISVPSVKPCRE